MKSIPLPPFAHVPQPYSGPSPEEVLALRKEFLSPAIFHYYKKPIMVVEGRGQWLFDEKGRRYLDGIGGIVTVSCGHCHPHIVAAANRQNELLQHTTTIYLNPNIALYARDLAAKMPGELKVVYFVNSGSEANDLALLMARAYTGCYDMIALRNGYHGGSQSTMGLTSHHTWKFNVPHGFGVQHSILPDLYRGPYGKDDPDAGRKYAEDIKSLVQFGSSGKLAAGPSSIPTGTSPTPTPT
jgi:alanine-glyoxylate transaminase/(R)-3-amino-2-methylpropionate-pyruvate transaminase